MGQKWTFVVTLYLQDLVSGRMWTPEYPLTASSEEEAENTLSKIVADFEIRGWSCLHVSISKAKKVRGE